MTAQKTFDQLRFADPSTDAVEDPEAYSPHQAINARIVFEPMPAQGHVRLTARSESYDLLWGVTASAKTLERHPIEVAFYDELINLARQHLPTETEVKGTESITHVLNGIAHLRKRLAAIEASVTPKKTSDKTEKRAAGLVPMINDAMRLLDAGNSGEL